jgi:hypothetical protein
MSWDVRDLSTVVDHFAFLKRRQQEIRKAVRLASGDGDLQLEAKVIQTEIQKLRKTLQKELKKKRRQLRDMHTES